MKTCTKCAMSKSLDDFHRAPKSRDGRAWWCKVCACANTRCHHEANGRSPSRPYEERRGSELKSKYGITAADYDAMLAAQGGVCAICHHPERDKGSGGKPKRLAVDHDAVSGVVRGLLCAGCNIGIGRLRHDLLLLASAIEYLTHERVYGPLSTELI